MHPRDGKENMTHQTRPSSTAPWSTSDAHKLVFGAFSIGQRPAWAACCVAPKALCVYTFISEPELLELLGQLQLDFGSDHADHPSVPTCVNDFLSF